MFTSFGASRTLTASFLAAFTLFIATTTSPVCSAALGNFGSGSEHMNLSQAREYMLMLINRDRAVYRLPPVSMDPIATVAAQKHTEEMSARGYMSHWDHDGNKPEARYTAAGGKDAVYENVSGWFDETGHALSKNQSFTKRELEVIESEFINEVPPHDGHRKNILDFAHNRVGIGLTLVDDEGDRRVQCAQEFLDQKGTYCDIPKRLTRGTSFSVAGKLSKDITFEKVEIMWEPYPKPLSVKQLNQELPYEDPTTSVLTCSDKTANPVSVKRTADGDEFVVTITPGQDWNRGLYYIWVWGRTKADRVKFIVSNRTALLG
jgi:uncharacterized protein YkwD